MRPPEQADKKIKLTEYFGIGNREQTQRKQFIWFAEEDAEGRPANLFDRAVPG